MKIINLIFIRKGVINNKKRGGCDVYNSIAKVSGNAG